MNSKHIIATEEEAYLDHSEKDADGGKDGFGWCDARNLLCKIHGIDCCV